MPKARPFLIVSAGGYGFREFTRANFLFAHAILINVVSVNAFFKGG